MGKAKRKGAPGEDVRAMVRDRRSSQGGKRGAVPPHLPIPPGAAPTVPEAELAPVRRAQDRLLLLRSELDLAQAEFNLAGRKLLQRYAVPPTHEIDLVTGEIRRKAG